MAAPTRSRSVRPRSPNILAGAGHGIWFNDHIDDDGPTVFKHAYKLGLEGIVSKRKDSP
jgi:bifunctional non-homologous end joining protein LigD